jgi:hypothetical protein
MEDDVLPDDGGSSPTTPKGNVYGVAYDASQLDPNVRALMQGYRWVTTSGGDHRADADYLLLPDHG